MKPRIVPLVVVFLLSFALSRLCPAQGDTFQVSTAEVSDSGEIVHRVTSSFQSGETKLRVLLPGEIKDGERLPVVFVLPVEAGDGTRYGDGLAEVRRLKLHERHRVICVAPTFALLPWFADHPTDASIRQESYLVEGVVPFLDRTYPTTGTRNGRLLLGFSKSGWGAFTLLLRNPDVFGKAAGWDAPFLMDKPGQYGSGPIFGTDEQFQKYRVTELLRQQSNALTESPRLLHLGYGNFREQHVGLERLLNELNISHSYRHGPRRPHTWSSGWLPEAMQMLCSQD